MPAVHARYHRQQFADTSGPGQRHVHEVVREVELLVFLPVVQAATTDQMMIERRDRAGRFLEPLGQLGCEVVAAIRRWLEQHQHADMQRLTATLDSEKRVVHHGRSEARSGGKECVSTCRSRGWQYP